MGVLVTTLITFMSTPLAGQAAEPAGFVLTNGKVYTVNKKQPWAEAVVVEGKKIVYVGDNLGAVKFKGEGWEELDLKGRLMLPGFVESHIHIGMGAGTTSGVILESSDTLEEVLKKIKE
jgi:predicted amidohydrolase YtcJ